MIDDLPNIEIAQAGNNPKEPSTWTIPVPKAIASPAIVVLLAVNFVDAIIFIPVIVIVAKTVTVAPPNTHWGILINIDENLGTKPATIITIDANIKIPLFIALFIVTIPTLELKVATGIQPNKAPNIPDTPFPIIPLDISSSVADLFIAPLVVADKSPIACTEFTIYITTIDIIAVALKLNPKCKNLGIWNQLAALTSVKETIPKNNEIIYPAIIPNSIEANFKVPFEKKFKKITTDNVIIATNQFKGEPNPSLPAPPAIYLIAVEYRESPIAKITVPVTIGGKNLISFLENIPKIIETNAPQIWAPNIVATLNSPAMAVNVGT